VRREDYNNFINIKLDYLYCLIFILLGEYSNYCNFKFGKISINSINFDDLNLLMKK